MTNSDQLTEKLYFNLDKAIDEFTTSNDTPKYLESCIYAVGENLKGRYRNKYIYSGLYFKNATSSIGKWHFNDGNDYNSFYSELLKYTGIENSNIVPITLFLNENTRKKMSIVLHKGNLDNLVKSDNLVPFDLRELNFVDNFNENDNLEWLKKFMDESIDFSKVLPNNFKSFFKKLVGNAEFLNKVEFEYRLYNLLCIYSRIIGENFIYALHPITHHVHFDGILQLCCQKELNVNQYNYLKDLTFRIVAETAQVQEDKEKIETSFLTSHIIGDHMSSIKNSFNTIKFNNPNNAELKAFNKKLQIVGNIFHSYGQLPKIISYYQDGCKDFGLMTKVIMNQNIKLLDILNDSFELNKVEIGENWEINENVKSYILSPFICHKDKTYNLTEAMYQGLFNQIISNIISNRKPATKISVNIEIKDSQTFIQYKNEIKDRYSCENMNSKGDLFHFKNLLQHTTKWGHINTYIENEHFCTQLFLSNLKQPLNEN